MIPHTSKLKVEGIRDIIRLNNVVILLCKFKEPIEISVAIALDISTYFLCFKFVTFQVYMCIISCFVYMKQIIHTLTRTLNK